MSAVAALGAHVGAHAATGVARLASALTTRLPAALDPDPDTARRWVQDELAGNEYQDRRSLLQRFLDWVQERLADLQGTPGRGGVSLPPFVIALLAGLVVVALVVLATRVRRERRTSGEGSATVLGDSTLTAQQLRERADRALEQGRYDDAVLDHVRAVARDADDRTLLTDAPALTAHEIGVRLSQVFPEHAGAVTRATDRFDAVAYGRVSASLEDALDVRDTGALLRRARPRLATTPAPAPAPGVLVGAVPGAAPAAANEPTRTTGPGSGPGTGSGSRSRSGADDGPGPHGGPGADAVWRGP